MGKILSIVSLLIGFVALVRSVLERRGPHRLPMLVLLRERFPRPEWNWMLIGLAAGSFMVVGPVGLANALGWAQLQINSRMSSNFFLLGLATVGIKLLWAAIEELIFRGAILPQSAKATNWLVALLISSLLFAWGHLERSGTSTPDLLSLLVFGFDGVGFGVAYLATRNLWLPTIWHATKNIWIWILFGESTLQLTPGFFRIRYTGPVLWVGSPSQAGLLDLTASLAVAAIVLVIYRHQFARGLEWVKSQ